MAEKLRKPNIHKLSTLVLDSDNYKYTLST